MTSTEPIHILGFTPLSVILAERLTYNPRNPRQNHSYLTLVEQASSSTIDDQWQSVHLLCLIHLLKQCRMLGSSESKKYGIDVQKVEIDEGTLYASIQFATQTIQKSYLRLLKQRQVIIHFIVDPTTSWPVPFQSNSVDGAIERVTPSIYNTYLHPSHTDLSLSPRLNLFQKLFHTFPSHPSLKFIGGDLFALEVAHLIAHLRSSAVYFYRMNVPEPSLLSPTDTNARLVTLLEIFLKSSHPPVVEKKPKEKDHPWMFHVIEEFHRFQIDPINDGILIFERIPLPIMPISRTPNEVKKEKRTYLKTFRQRSQMELSSSNLRLDTTTETSTEFAEPLDSFPIDSTFFIRTDPINLSDPTIPLGSASKSIGTFNQTPSSMIRTIYETLRTVSNQLNLPQLTDLFLSVDHELCVLRHPHLNAGQSSEKVDQSPEHDLQRPVENLHDLYKITQRPIDPDGPFILNESQVFQNDALDLQSLILLFDPNKEIPSNELLFLFTDAQEWYQKLNLPDSIDPLA